VITEIVTWKFPKDMTREQVAAAFRKSLPNWQQNPDLLRKNYIYDSTNGLGGGVYLWKKIDDAKRWHGDAFRKRVNELYGSEPTFTYFETPIAIDNTTGAVIDEGVGA
jgi:hypothetical protein